MRDPERIEKLLGKISYIMKNNDLTLMESIYQGIDGEPKDPYHVEDDWINENLSDTQTLDFKEFTEECEAIYYIWTRAPDLRLTQLICNSLPRSRDNPNNLYSKHPIEYSNEDIMKLTQNYYFPTNIN